MTSKEITLLIATRKFIRRIYGKDCKCELKKFYTHEGGIKLSFYINGKILIVFRFGDIETEFIVTEKMFEELPWEKEDLEKVLLPYKDCKIETEDDLGQMFGLDVAYCDDGKGIGIENLVWRDNGVPWEIEIYNVKSIWKNYTLK